MSGRAPGARGLAVALALALCAAGVVAVSRARAGRSATPPSAAPVAEGAGAGGAGYVLMDLPAIKRAVHRSGRPVLVHFWASWCGPCLDELPLMDRFARDARARGVDVLSLSLDDPARAGERVVRTLVQKAPGLTRNIVHVDDADGFINAIDSEWEGAIPALFAYDSQGRLRGRLIGEASPRDLENLISRLVRPGKSDK